MVRGAAEKASGAGNPDRNLTGLRALPHRFGLALSAVWAAITGLAPHVLHHAGPLAGAALFAGVAGTLLFGAVGLLLAIPFLRRMHRRYGTWRAPAIALALFVAVFSLSTFVIGPQITGDEDPAPANPRSGPGENGHTEHH